MADLVLGDLSVAQKRILCGSFLAVQPQLFRLVRACVHQCPHIFRPLLLDFDSKLTTTYIGLRAVNTYLTFLANVLADVAPLSTGERDVIVAARGNLVWTHGEQLRGRCLSRWHISCRTFLVLTTNPCGDDVLPSCPFVLPRPLPARCAAFKRQSYPQAG